MTHGGKRKGAGRPPRSTKSDSRTERVYLRLHPSEKRELIRRASRRNMSVSEYLLVSALSGLDAAPASVVS